MAAAGRLGDRSQIWADAHGCPACPHLAVGPAITGSPSVNINSRPALRVDDTGIHAACCGPNVWTAAQGAPSVFINGRAAHRLGDGGRHCGGMGKLIDGSGDVHIGNLVDAGGGSGVAPAPRAERRGLATLTANGIGPSSALMLPAPGVAGLLDVDSIAGAIGNFRHGFKAGVTSLVGSIAEMGLSFGLGRMVGLLDEALFGLGTVLKNVVWAVGKYIPGLSTLLPSVRAYVQEFLNFLLNLDALPADGPCPAPMLMTPSRPLVDLIFSQPHAEGLWEACKDGDDVSRLAQRLLETYRPIFVEDPSDLRGITMEELLAHSVLVPPPPMGTTPTTLAAYRQILEDHYGAPNDDHRGNLDIDEPFARGRTEPSCGPTYYGQAFRRGANHIELFYFALRAGSFFPNGHLDQSMFEHEGDGEGCGVIVRRRGPGDPWLLTGTKFDGAHYKKSCGQVAAPDPDAGAGGYPLPVETVGGRPVVYVAVGSHAMCGQSGKRRLRNKDGGIKGFFVSLAVDHYPEKSGGTTIRDYDLRTSRDLDINLAVFTRRIYWGQGVAVLGASVYGGQEHRAIPEALEDLPAVERDPLWKNP